MTLLALRNSIAILMASLGVAILGLVALDRLPVDLFPNINLPIINVGTIYTGAGVLDIEKTVTYPIEKAVSAVSDVKFVESKSRQGLSTVRLWMNWGADVNNGQTEVIQRIQQILNSLPTGIKQPFIVRYDLSNIPVVLVTVSGGGLDERQLYDLTYNAIEPQLERLGGVASASIDGGKVRQITVNLNRDQLYAKGVSIVDVVSAVNSANFLLPAGDMKAGRLDYNLYTNNQFAIVRPMENIVVRTVGPNGVPIHVKDLGYVADSHETQTSIVRIDDTRGVFLSVNKQPGPHTIAVVELENINRHLNISDTPRRQAVLDAAREVAMPIFSATITTIIVFVPTVFLEGQIKLLFIPLTFTISISLFASFLVSRTVTPLLALKVLRPERSIDPASRSLRDRVFRFSRSFFERTEEVYQHIVVWALGHRPLVIGSIAVTFVASLSLVLAPRVGRKPLIGTEVFPPSDEAQFRINVKAPIGTRIEETERIVKGMDAIVRAAVRPEELKTLVTNVGIPQGRSAVFTGNTGPHSATVQVYLTTADKRQRSDREIVNAIRPAFVG